MNLRRIKHAFLRLTAEEKVVGLGCLLVLIGIFMPWYSVVLNFDKNSVTESGLSGDLGVLGFVVLLMILLSLLTLVSEHIMNIRLPRFGYTKEQILFFLMGQGAFLVLLAVAIYTKRSLEFTDADLRFGIYLTLIGAFLGVFAIFSQIQKLKKKEVSEFFEHEDTEDTEDIKESKKKKHIGEQFEEVSETAVEEPEEDQMLFEEETKAVILDEKIPEDEMIAEGTEFVEDEEIEEIAPETKKKKDPEPETQRDYFMREAGVEETGDAETTNDASQDEETKAEPEDDEDKKDEGLSMGFYEDQ
jgi:hypothetical protein